MEKTQQKEIHMQFRDFMSVSLLFAALKEKNPHFLNVTSPAVVEEGGKERQETVFRILRELSTSFPHTAVERKSQ
ncbi:MAG: hypothetical protein QUS14_09680 [Pyrinomonadaceae bacterium]|nr:hypothetical protein [Pyrinomonadaceae bacterium]